MRMTGDLGVQEVCRALLVLEEIKLQAPEWKASPRAVQLAFQQLERQLPDASRTELLAAACSLDIWQPRSTPALYQRILQRSADLAHVRPQLQCSWSCCAHVSCFSLRCLRASARSQGTQQKHSSAHPTSWH